jgi:hypothetical protein
VFSRKVFSKIDTPWGISSGRTLCCGTYAACSRGVVEKENIDTPWGTSSWQALRYGTYAVFAGEILFESTLLGASPPCGRCVVNRAPCSQGKCFLNRHSLGHLLMADTVLWDVRCVIKESIFSDRHSFWHLFMVDAVLWDVRCVLDQSIF